MSGPNSPWQTAIDPTSNRRYWYNPYTRQSSWTQPPPAGRGSGGRSQYPTSSGSGQTSAVDPRTLNATPSATPSATSTSQGQVRSESVGATSNYELCGQGGALAQGMTAMSLAGHPRHFAPTPTPNTPYESGAASSSRPQPSLEGSTYTQPLDKAFKVRDKPRKFFKEGRVFLIVWSEKTSESRTSEQVHEVIFGEKVYSSIRRFVVIRAGPGSCSCLSILTYGRRGLGKSGARKSDHAVIYTGNAPPPLLPDEQPIRNGDNLQSMSFKVEPFEPDEKLNPMSRINLRKVYNIEYDAKVKGLGTVTNMHGLNGLWEKIWYENQASSSVTGTPSPAPYQTRVPTGRNSGSMPTPIQSRNSLAGYHAGVSAPTSSYGSHGKAPVTGGSYRQPHGSYTSPHLPPQEEAADEDEEDNEADDGDEQEGSTDDEDD